MMKGGYYLANRGNESLLRPPSKCVLCVASEGFEGEVQSTMIMFLLKAMTGVQAKQAQNLNPSHSGR